MGLSSITDFKRSAIEDLAAADRAPAVEDLLLFLEALRGVLEERDDLLDRVLHAVELLERRVPAYHAIAEQAA
jgi:hypothetical protein